MLNHKAGWQLLQALGIPKELRVVKAVATMEVGHLTTVDCTVLADVKADSPEVTELLKRFELVEKVEHDGTEAP